MVKRVVALLLSIIMIISVFPGRVFAAEFSDMPNNWSTAALENAVSNGLLNGYNGKIRPDDNLTRAEMATIVNRAFGAEEKALISQYGDVSKDAWYYDEMAKAVEMGIFVGDGKGLNPDKNITREEVFIVLARSFKLSSTNDSSLNIFSDKNEVSIWAKEGVSSLVTAGYIAGSNDKLNPKENITRAEFAQLMDNLIKVYLNKEGIYTTINKGNVMVNVPNVKLKDIIVNGDLIVGDGVGDGEVTLENVTVTGRIVIRGSGKGVKVKAVRGGTATKDVDEKKDGSIGGGGGHKDVEEDYDIEADLRAYNLALGAVVEKDYTRDSWTIYQAVVKANVVTSKSSQAAVDSATAAILAAQAKLVKKSEGSVLAKINIIQGNIILGYDKIKVTLNVDNPEDYKVGSSALSEFVYNPEEGTFTGVVKTGTTAKELFITKKDLGIKARIVSMPQFLPGIYDVHVILSIDNPGDYKVSYDGKEFKLENGVFIGPSYTNAITVEDLVIVKK